MNIRKNENGNIEITATPKLDAGEAAGFRPRR